MSLTRARLAFKAGYAISGLWGGFYWTVQAMRHRNLAIPSTDPAPVEAIELGRELAERYGWKDNEGRERLADALRDILDVTTGWTSAKTTQARLAYIDRIARAALSGAQLDAVEARPSAAGAVPVSDEAGDE